MGAVRLWRDRAHLREQERDEAQVQARVAAEKLASLTAENARLVSEIARLRDLIEELAAENARLRAQLLADPSRARAEIEQGMEEVRSELLSLLAPANEVQV
jgi:predicted RNase H-like nuclease (RuvC/YqgF family)